MGLGNAQVESKSNAILVTKQASGSAKIDPLMAAFNAIALMSTIPRWARPSIFVIEKLYHMVRMLGRSYAWLPACRTAPVDE